MYGIHSPPAEKGSGFRVTVLSGATVSLTSKKADNTPRGGGEKENAGLEVHGPNWCRKEDGVDLWEKWGGSGAE